MSHRSDYYAVITAVTGDFDPDSVGAALDHYRKEHGAANAFFNMMLAYSAREYETFIYEIHRFRVGCPSTIQGDALTSRIKLGLDTMKPNDQDREQPPHPLYFPCIMDEKSGRINKKVGEAMTLTEAIALLRREHNSAWLLCLAIPQPTTHSYFTNPKDPYYVG